MCYSAQVWALYRRYAHDFGADISIREFAKLYGFKRKGERIRTPKAMDAVFLKAESADEVQIKEDIEAINADEEKRLQAELFKQRKRLADAERTLEVKTTKAATESKRIAGEKVQWALGKLADLHRTELIGEDSRMFPGWYVPVMISENGRRVVKPMRYQCRPAGKPAFYDTKYPGLYNARRDNLERFWKGQFGVTHGIMVVTKFYENVDRDGQNVVLEFTPKPAHDMLVACLWSRWQGPGEEELLSFAAITDEPPSEVAAAGHDRCIVPIKPKNVDAWLNPKPGELAALYAILDDRDSPYYEHRLAA